MAPTLYFLRSSESKIVKDMTQYAHPKSDNLNIYYDFYGLTTKDLGLYALVENKIAGAIWSRRLGQEETPTLSLGILPEFREKGIATAMMEQFLLEAASQFTSLKVNTYNNEKSNKFYIKHGFTNIKGSNIMEKSFEKQEVVRPTDGYDPRRWMD